jgi:hypothetical protein
VAIVVEGGLVSSTFLTLIVIPVVYSLVKRREARRGPDLDGRPGAAGQREVDPETGWKYFGPRAKLPGR